MIAPEDDLDAIMRIMQAAFDPAYGEAWTRRQVMDALVLSRCRYGMLDSAGNTPTDPTNAVGFFLSRQGFEEEELLLFAVDPASRQRGIGRKLLNQLAEFAQKSHALRLLLEMRRGNPAERLYVRFGFTQIGERRNYYTTPDGTTLDAITFEFKL